MSGVTHAARLGTHGDADLADLLTYPYVPVQSVMGRLAGYAGGDLFLRFFDPEKHVLRSHNALATDESVLQALRAAGCGRVVAVARKEKMAYVAAVRDFFESGVEVFYAGPQRALPLSEWGQVAVTDKYVRSLSRVVRSGRAQ